MCVCLCISWLNYPTSTAHAPCYTAICGLFDLQHFPTLTQKGTVIQQKKNIGHKMREFDFFSTTFSETFFILKIIQRDSIINVHEFSRQIFL